MILELLFLAALFLVVAVSAFCILCGLWRAAEWCWTRWDRWINRIAGAGF